MILSRSKDFALIGYNTLNVYVALFSVKQDVQREFVVSNQAV